MLSQQLMWQSEIQNQQSRQLQENEQLADQQMKELVRRFEEMENKIQAREHRIRALEEANGLQTQRCFHLQQKLDAVQGVGFASSTNQATSQEPETPTIGEDWTIPPNSTALPAIPMEEDDTMLL